MRTLQDDVQSIANAIRLRRRRGEAVAYFRRQPAAEEVLDERFGVVGHGESVAADFAECDSRPCDIRCGVVGGSSESTVTVRRGGHAVTLHLVWDPEAKIRALARGGGHALFHAGQSLAPELAHWMQQLGRSFTERMGASAVDTAAATRVLLELVPDAELVNPAGPPLPKWSAALRAGTPREDLGGVIPFDPELAALRAGLRSVIKREALEDAEAGMSEAWLRRQGLVTRRLDQRGGDGQIVIFASVRTEELELAEQLEARDATTAKQELGALLGYPRCCSNAFARLELRDDRALLEALLPPPGSAPAPPESLWLSGPLALVSHAPCSLHCEETLALGRKILALLTSELPGWEPRWRVLAQRLHVIDDRGTCLALRTDGERIAVADEIVAPRGVALVPLTKPRPELVGQRITDLAICFAADHRLSAESQQSLSKV